MYETNSTLYGSDDGTHLNETILFVWTLSIISAFNRELCLGSQFCFHLQEKWEEAPNVVDPLTGSSLSHWAGE